MLKNDRQTGFIMIEWRKKNGGTIHGRAGKGLSEVGLWTDAAAPDGG